jgi:hypothetical protein
MTIDSRIKVIRKRTDDLEERVKKQIFVNFPFVEATFDASIYLLAKQLCGENFWNALTFPHRRSAGKIIGNLVTQRKIPFKEPDGYDNRDDQYKRQYLRMSADEWDRISTKRLGNRQ